MPKFFQPSNAVRSAQGKRRKGDFPAVATVLPDDENYGPASIKRTVQTITRLRSLVIKFIRDISNVEDPLTFLSSDRFNCVNTKIVDELMLQVDYLIYANC